MRRSATSPRSANARWPGLDPEIHGDLNDFARAIELVRPGDLQRLIAFWETVDLADRDAAHEHAQAAAARTLRRDVIHTLQEDLIAWGGPTESARSGIVDAWMPARTAQDDRRRALPALLDTALALTVQDELDDDDFETLFGPWRDAMGDEDDDAEAAPDEAAGEGAEAGEDAAEADADPD